MEDQYGRTEGIARYSNRWCRISAVSRSAPDLKTCRLISLQHVGGNDNERRLLPFCPRRRIPGQPDVWTLCSPFCTVANPVADSCPGDTLDNKSRHFKCISETIPAMLSEKRSAGRFNTTIMGQKVVLSHVKFVGTDNVCLSGLREAGMLGFVKSQ